MTHIEEFKKSKPPNTSVPLTVWSEVPKLVLKNGHSVLKNGSWSVSFHTCHEL